MKPCIARSSVTAPTAAQRLATALRRHHVDVMFSQSLPSALILACEDLGIRQISYRAENAGGAMADGYARRSNRIGVVTAQNGPAATLLVPPLAEALKASVPVLALVQDVNRAHADRNAFQEIDHLRLFDSCTKWARVVTDAARIEDYLDMAITTATSGRPGPVALMLPADMLNESAAPPPFARTATLGAWPLDRPAADPDRVREAAAIIASARHPLVIAGGGVHSSQAHAELAQLQSLASLPVAYTMMGKGSVADTAPLTAGLVGNVMGQRSLGHHLRGMVERADVIVLAGTRTNQNGTDSWTLFSKQTRFIHIDIDGTEIGRTHEALRLVGDVRETLRALNKELASQDLAKRHDGAEQVQAEIREARDARTRANADLVSQGSQPLRPEYVMQVLDGLIGSHATVVADASYSSVWIASYLAARRSGMRFLSPRGLAGLGWGLPMAIGARLAAPDHPVVCVVGDGGFGHVWGELETLAREEIGVVLLLLNNGVLGFQKDAETLKFGQHTGACHFAPVDHAAIARACGLEAWRIEKPEEVRPRLVQALASSKTVLLELMTHPDAYPPLTMYDGALPY
ncbi:MAG: acetolactate synthase catalytic subunit [Gammaproteobacteria bacterium]